MPQSLKFLFWNVHRSHLGERIARISEGHNVNVVALVEHPETKQNKHPLNTPNDQPWSDVSPTIGGKFRVWLRGAINSVLILTDPHWLVYGLKSGSGEEVILAVVHLRSQLHSTDADKVLELRRLATDVAQVEADRGHTRSVLVGDFNLNPFSELLVQSDTLHSVMTRALAGRETRQVRNQLSERMFYNPMWGLLGDRTPGPPGTYYRTPSGVISYFWHTLDQVLLRPSLSNGLTELRILDTDGRDSLLTPNGLPDQGRGSDHLPVLFGLEW